MGKSSQRNMKSRQNGMKSADILGLKMPMHYRRKLWTRPEFMWSQFMIVSATFMPYLFIVNL
jgi:hypothetical protein